MSKLTIPDGWTQGDAGLTKTFTFADFPHAVAFTVELGRQAETANHHPDLDLRWNQVHVLLVTHDAGNTITEKDVALAGQANQISEAALAERANALFGS